MLCGVGDMFVGGSSAVTSCSEVVNGFTLEVPRDLAAQLTQHFEALRLTLEHEEAHLREQSTVFRQGLIAQANGRKRRRGAA